MHWLQGLERVLSRSPEDLRLRVDSRFPPRRDLDSRDGDSNDACAGRRVCLPFVRGTVRMRSCHRCVLRESENPAFAGLPRQRDLKEAIK